MIIILFFGAFVMIIMYNIYVGGFMNKKRNNWKKTWLIRQNKKRLKHRNERKEKKKKINRIKQLEFRKNKNDENYNAEKKEKKFTAPPQFSLVNNTDATIKYFSDIINYINRKNYDRINIYLDVENVEVVSIDAIMYMLAVVKNTKVKHNSRGNVPINIDAKTNFYNSGFYNYVNTNSNIIKPKDYDRIQIKQSDKSNDNRVHSREIIDFLIVKTNIMRRKWTFLYNMLSELMTNTNEHAYESDDLLKYWYVYVEIVDNSIRFTFLDTGVGIPSTVSKNFIERIQILGINTDSDYIISALNGKFKTQTGKKYRGKGLPKITDYNKNNRISKFMLLSGNGYVKYDYENQNYTSEHIDNKLIGTLYYWEIDLDTLKEEEND